MAGQRSAWRTEIIAGITTFLSMSYIVVVNPQILSAAGMPPSGVMTATVLLCFLMTLAMGLFAKLPYAVAPGMGLNAFFTYSLVIGEKIPWPTALGLVFWAGVLFLLLSVTPLREHIARAIPPHLRIASAIGIGLFLTFIGLKNANIVVANPVTFVQLGTFTRQVGVSILGMFVMIGFLRKKNPFAFLIGMAAITFTLWQNGSIASPGGSVVAMPDFTSVLFKLNPLAALRLSFIPAIFAITFTDLFDSLSTFMGLSRAAGLTDSHGNPKQLREGLIVDALATFGASLLGTSAGTAYIESMTGIEAGGRTGRTAIVAALCFLPCLFLAPLVTMVPAAATAPVLIIVGATMFAAVRELKFAAYEDMLPQFLMMTLIPLTFSISRGLEWGFVAHVGCYMFAGRSREVSKTMYILAAISMLLLLQSGH